MLIWIKKHSTIIVTILVTVGLIVYLYGCESKCASLTNGNPPVNRAELQLELDQFISLAQIRMLSLDQQDRLRGLIIQNALIIAQGQPFNPLGLLTAVAGIYGVTQGSSNITKLVKDKRNGRNSNNS